MRSRWNLPILIGYSACAVAMLVGLVAALGVTMPWSHPYVVTANFSDANGILTGNEVYMNGAEIGRVSAVTVHSGTAWVSLSITDAAALPLYRNATAEVRTKNLLGETYIDLQRGTSTCQSCRLQSGSTIPLQHTVPITEVDQVLAIFDPTTVERVQLLINALGDGTAGQGKTLNQEAKTTSQLVTSLNTPAATLSIRRQQVNDIVMELQSLYSVLAQQRSQVLSAMTNWNAVMGQLATQESSIGQTVVQADSLITQLNTLLQGEQGNVQSTLASLPAALTAANALLEHSGGLLTSLEPYRGDIHNIFPNLASSFADTDAQGQHFWSVYSVTCVSSCGASSASAPSTGSTSTSGASDANSVWSGEASS